MVRELRREMEGSREEREITLRSTLLEEVSFDLYLISHMRIEKI